MVDEMAIATVTGTTLAAPLPSGVPHPAAVYLAGLGEGSRRAIDRSLDLLVETITDSGPLPGAGLVFPWWELRYSHTAAIRARLQGRVAPATANKALSALRRVLKEAWRLGLMTVEDYQRAADLPNIPGSTIPAGRDISQGEVTALMGDCTKGDRNIDYRDGAVLAVMLGGGLRRSEVASLALEDFSLDDGRVLVRRAKRNKQRVVYLPMGAISAVLDWIDRRGSAPGPLFLAVNKGDRIIHGKALSTQAIQVIVTRRAGSSGVASVSPHDFRRTFVGNLLDAGVDLATVQGLVGHASPTTTARYDRRPEAVKQAAAGKLHIPYQRR
jgi:integrase